MKTACRAARAISLGLVCWWTAVGCGRSAATERNTVKGVVKLGSTPLTDGIVTLHAADGGTATGAVLPDGNYSIDDPPLGMCQVTVTPSPGFTSPTANAADDSHAPPEARRSPIPAKYHKPGNGLSVEVKVGTTHYNVELK